MKVNGERINRGNFWHFKDARSATIRNLVDTMRVCQT